jgi:hypothetical protein
MRKGPYIGALMTLQIKVGVETGIAVVPCWKCALAQIFGMIRNDVDCSGEI